MTGPNKPGKPDTLTVLRQDIQNFISWLRDGFEKLIMNFFAINQRSASIRSTLLGLLVISALLLFFYLAFREGLGMLPAVLLVTRRMILVWLAYRIASQAAAVYLDDIFELEDVGVAAQYINKAAFASMYDKIVIRDGDIDPRYKNSPIFRIGGPGMVEVHVENAVLFEKIDGTPHVIGPSRRRVPIEGFERLRAVFDLRDQMTDPIDVTGRTKDGIPITARDVRAVFSVYRGSQPSQGQEPIDKSQPFTFTEKAIENLVYNQRNPDKYNNSYRDWISVANNRFRSKLRDFISQHPLSMFITNVSGDTSGDFISREELTELLYSFAHGSSSGAEFLGFEIQWIGVGTWETREEINQRHLKAWKKSRNVDLNSSEFMLKKLRKDSRVSGLVYLIHDTPLDTFGTLMFDQLRAMGHFILPDTEGEETMSNTSPMYPGFGSLGTTVEDREYMWMSPRRFDQDTTTYIKSQLILNFREKLRNAHDHYHRQDKKVPRELEIALQYLARITARWVGS